jgi:hypothetical protein
MWRRGSMEHSLVMSVSYPGGCAQGADDDGNVGERSNDEDCVDVHRTVSESEVVDNLENEPGSTRQRTAAVNAS